MNVAHKRNRLLPWTIGLVIILAADAYAAWAMLTNPCALPNAVLALVLVVMPAVYLALMYVTLKYQE